MTFSLDVEMFDAQFYADCQVQQASAKYRSFNHLLQVTRYNKQLISFNNKQTSRPVYLLSNTLRIWLKKYLYTTQMDRITEFMIDKSADKTT